VSIAYLLVFLGLGVFGVAAWALFWAVDSGQYDDLEAQGAAILEEDEPPPEVTSAAPGPATGASRTSA
jgi:cbb3-type cytochrome oxidase maturation protein